jgi:hypothetical protein
VALLIKIKIKMLGFLVNRAALCNARRDSHFIALIKFLHLLLSLKGYVLRWKNTLNLLLDWKGMSRGNTKIFMELENKLWN